MANVPKDGSTINLDDLFSRLALRVATDFLLGESSMTLTPSMKRKSERFIASFRLANEGIFQRLMMGRFMSFSRNYKFDEACRFLHEYIDEAVQRLLDAGKLGLSEKSAAGKEDKTRGRYIFLHELLKLTDDPIELRSQVLSMLIAGTETTASLLVSTFSLLSRDQRVWDKLREEVSQLRGEKPTLEHVRELKYVRAVINEG
jgi:cytochrome P450